jgi:hypothetical protein
MAKYNRPLSLPLLVYLLWLLALVIIALAFYVFFYEDDFWNHGILKVLGSELIRLITVLSFCILLIISGIGILKSSPSGRGLLVFLCSIAGIHALIMIFSGLLRGILVLLICVVVTIYLFTPGVSAEFQSIDSRKAVDAIETLESYRKSRIY